MTPPRRTTRSWLVNNARMTTVVAQRPRVLLVDDERELLETLVEALKTEFTLATASSAEEAELMMEANFYDVIVSDHLMVGATGLDFLIRMQQKFPTTLRILTTGYINPELITRSISLAGLSACLIKPLHASQIAEAIQAGLAAK